MLRGLQLIEMAHYRVLRRSYRSDISFKSTTAIVNVVQIVFQIPCYISQLRTYC
jgi:hypothetical protein